MLISKASLEHVTINYPVQLTVQYSASLNKKIHRHPRTFRGSRSNCKTLFLVSIKGFTTRLNDYFFCNNVLIKTL